MNKQRGPLEEIGGDWFVNRKEELDLFWQWATSIPERVYGSYALIGLRRTGKTAILHRLFNRLFNEQERLLPVYISFARYLQQAEPINAYQFAQEYFTGYIRSYLAFRYRQPQFHRDKSQLNDLGEFAKQVSDEFVIELLQSYDREPVNKRAAAHSLMQWVINFPKGQAWGRNMPTVILIDEFQVLTRVSDPDDGKVRNLTDSFQEAAETHWAPLLVSGSSVSMIVNQALGGMLSGRFRPTHLGPLSQEFAYQMVFQLGHRHNIAVTEELALGIWELTKGYPYSIECLLTSRSPDIQKLPSLEALSQVMIYELTQPMGFLRSHYRQEYGKYIHEMNGDQTIRKVLLWIITYPDRRIFADEIAAELQLDEQQVSISLDKLNEADIIASTGWYSYEAPTDPMLRRYIEYSHAREVEKLAPDVATKSLLKEYNRLQGEMNRRVGHLAEIIVGGVMRSFDGSTVDGMVYFNTPATVTLPKLSNLERRSGVIKEGEQTEIDLIGEWRTSNTLEAMGESGVWLVSVRHRNDVMGEGEVRKFLTQTATWLGAKQQEKQTEKPFDRVTRWYVSKLGFTQAATQVLQAEGVYYSNLAQFNLLADRFGFLPLRDDKQK